MVAQGLFQYDSDVQFTAANAAMFCGAHKRLIELMREYAEHEPWKFVTEDARVRNALMGYAQGKKSFDQAKSALGSVIAWGMPMEWPVSG